MLRFAPLLAVLLVGCSNPVASDADAGPDAVRVVMRDVLSDHRDPYELRDARVEGDELVLEIGHSGGCATHRFSLMSTPLRIRTNPPGADLVLVHDDGGDLCRGYFFVERRFDLTALRHPSVREAALFFWPYEATEAIVLRFRY